MAIPLLIPIIAAGGGVILGALSRQPEINRLKVQVKRLQKEIDRLRDIIKEQDRQIKGLKRDYNCIKAYQFKEKAKAKAKAKGAIMHQYAYKEYVELCCLQAEGTKLSDKEKKFFNIYENLLNGIDVDKESKIYIKKYLMDKYKNNINGLVTVNAEDIVRNVEGTRLG